VIRSDGSSVRDYLYVDDGAAAYLRTAECLARDRSLAGDAFNFSNETPITVLALVDKILVAAGRPISSPTFATRHRTRFPAQYLDSAKARARLAWSPQFTLEAGLARPMRGTARS